MTATNRAEHPISQTPQHILGTRINADPLPLSVFTRVNLCSIMKHAYCSPTARRGPIPWLQYPIYEMVCLVQFDSEPDSDSGRQSAAQAELPSILGDTRGMNRDGNAEDDERASGLISAHVERCAQHPGSLEHRPQSDLHAGLVHIESLPIIFK